MERIDCSVVAVMMLSASAFSSADVSCCISVASKHMPSLGICDSCDGGHCLSRRRHTRMLYQANDHQTHILGFLLLTIV